MPRSPAGSQDQDRAFSPADGRSPGGLAGVGKRHWIGLGAYAAAIVAAEALLVGVSVIAGLAAHALVAFAGLTREALSLLGGRRSGSGVHLGGSFAALAFVPLARVTGAAIPLESVPETLWPAVAAVPVLLGLAVARKPLKDRGLTLGLSFRAWPLQLLLGLVGAVLGAAAYFFVTPAPLGASKAPPLILAASAVALLAGFAEELLFRGLVQRSMERVFGGAAVFWSGLLFASLYLGARPLLLLPVMAAAGLFFAWCAWKTKSTTGAALAHGMFKVSLLVAAPLVFG